jgi:hypothetical protein
MRKETHTEFTGVTEDTEEYTSEISTSGHCVVSIMLTGIM